MARDFPPVDDMAKIPQDLTAGAVNNIHNCFEILQRPIYDSDDSSLKTSVVCLQESINWFVREHFQRVGKDNKHPLQQQILTSFFRLLPTAIMEIRRDSWKVRQQSG